MKFDYCTMLVNREEMELLPLHLNSLFHHNTKDSVNVKISVPDNDPEIINYCNQFPVEVCLLPKHPHYGRPGNGHRQVGYDSANRMDKLVRTCTTDFVVLSHLDIVHTEPMIPSIRKK